MNITGINITGENIVIKDGKVFIDGKEVSQDNIQMINKTPHLIINGNITNVDCTSITVNGDVLGNVDCTSIICESVKGNVDAVQVNISGRAK